MREALVQTFQNSGRNKLRSFLTMFGILWGVISVVILSATGEGFRRGNEHVLDELGKNIGIVWGGRTSLQAGGERAGRRIMLTADDARALAAESRLVRVVSPRSSAAAMSVKSALQRRRRSASTASSRSYQDIRTLDLEDGGSSTGPTSAGARVSPSSAPTSTGSCSPARQGIGQPVTQRHAATRRRQDPEEGPGQQLQRPGQRQGVRAVRGDGAATSRVPNAAQPDAVSNIIVTP